MSQEAGKESREYLTSQIRDRVTEETERGKQRERLRIEQKARLDAVRWEAKVKEEEQATKTRGIIPVEVPRTPQGRNEKEAEEYLVDLGLEKEMVEKIEKVEGKLQVRVKEGDEGKTVEKINKKGGRPIARSMEQWAGIVGYAVDTKNWGGEGGMGHLKVAIEERLGTTLMKEPRWLANKNTWRGDPKQAAIIFHVARHEERKRLVGLGAIVTETEDEYLSAGRITGWKLAMRDFLPVESKYSFGRIAQPTDLCNTCSEFGHLWYKCPTKKPKCGLCATTGHTSYFHPCGTKVCTNKGACGRLHEEESGKRRCTRCGGKHGVKECKEEKPSGCRK